jgi:hypothetical protein
LFLLGTEPTFPGRPTCSLIIIRNDLSRLHRRADPNLLK